MYLRGDRFQRGSPKSIFPGTPSGPGPGAFLLDLSPPIGRGCRRSSFILIRSGIGGVDGGKGEFVLGGPIGVGEGPSENKTRPRGYKMFFKQMTMKFQLIIKGKTVKNETYFKTLRCCIYPANKC